MNSEQRQQAITQGFTPSSPVDSERLFAGRKEQRRDILSAIHQAGQHVIIFGERGVGKTSLANIIVEQCRSLKYLTVRVNCDASDNFTSSWRKIAGELLSIETEGKVGFKAQPELKAKPLSSLLPEKTVKTDDVKNLLRGVTRDRPLVVVFDEFDRLRRTQTQHFADTIKTLSDHNIKVTLILVGVADSVNKLIAEHQSIERALVQILMPRMSNDELMEIVRSGLSSADMDIEPRALEAIVALSQGLPHYTHLLGLHSAYRAIDRGQTKVEPEDVREATKKAVDKAQESIKASHYEAVISQRKDTLHSQVLLACALARLDARGYFAAADVREPLSRIMKKLYDIPAYSQHLNAFCTKERGQILQKTGTPRRYRFRFTNPLMQPFVILNGLSTGQVNESDLLPAVSVTAG